MTKHIFRRIIQAIPTLFGITFLSYLIMTAAPGDPVSLLNFGNEDNDAEAVERLKIQLGVNDPWPVQYLRWLIGDDWMFIDADQDGIADERTPRYGILRGDFGRSFRFKRPVMEMIADRIPATLELGVASLVVSLALGIPIGIMAAITRGKLFDNVSRVLAVVFNAVPAFWMGLILILVFGSMLNLLPMGNRCDPIKHSRTPCPPVYERLEYIILPTFVLAVGGIAGFSRFMRTSMLDTINSDYVRTARAKGLPTRDVWMRHAARNALIPIATFLGPAIVGVIGGAVITETIFTWPGLGRLFIDAINSRDYPLVMASVLIGSILTIIGFIVSDILYGLFDPRIRF